jgi:hypothetical protein
MFSEPQPKLRQRLRENDAFSATQQILFEINVSLIKPGLWIRIQLLCGSVLGVRIQGQENEEISLEKCTFSFFFNFTTKKGIKQYYFLKKILMNNTGIFDSTQSLISTKFEKEIVFERSVLAWIRFWIRIEQKCWLRIRIRIKSIRIHNPESNTELSCSVSLINPA